MFEVDRRERRSTSIPNKPLQSVEVRTLGETDSLPRVPPVTPRRTVVVRVPFCVWFADCSRLGRATQRWARGTITVWYPQSLATTMHTLVRTSESWGNTVHGRVIGSSEVIGQLLPGGTAPMSSSRIPPRSTPNLTGRGGEFGSPVRHLRVRPFGPCDDAHGPWAARLRKGPWYDVATRT